MLQLEHICKAYTTGSFTQRALDDVSVAFRDNEFVAILGPSGSGKTTMLNIIGGLDHYDSGDLIIDGISTKQYHERDWDTYRNNRIGFVFQSYNLITHQTVLSNVELALTLSGIPRAERRQRAIEALERVGLGDHIDKKPAQMSGGQMQRVAIARALVNDPDILLADEPTGALDTETGIQVMDLLAEVAKDRLVIMVTHNPELAEQYATRIVNIHDGRIEHDSMPFDPATEPTAPLVPAAADGWTETAARAAALADAPATATGWRSATNAALERAEEPLPTGPGATAGTAHGRAHSAEKGTKKSRMSFLTALSLSFNNLMTKKGRTFLTAFAGSIGIIGIAAILALSNGVNAYIEDTEEEALTSYPLTITKSSFDLSNLLTGMTGYASADDESGTGSAGGAGGEATASLIPQSTIMTDMFAKVKNNDLKAFKAFLDEGGNGIWNYVNDIEYDYGIDPLIYKADTSDGLVKLNPGYMSSVFSNGLNSSALISMGSGMSSFQEMLEDRGLMESQMEVVEGRWPESYDEAVLVLSRRGKISDYTLYSLGVMDPKAMEEMTKQALNGEDVVVPDEHVDFTYEEAMNLRFKVVPAAATYKHNDEQNTWTDMSKDTDFMREAVDNGIELKVVGIVKTREDASSSLFSEGIAYPKSLTYHLMEEAAESPIVKQQMENRDVDVFTGRTFDELQNDQNNEFDLANIFTIDEGALQNAFSFDSSALSSFGSSTDLDLSGFDMSSLTIDPDGMEINADAIASATPSTEAVATIIRNAPTTVDVNAANPSLEPTQAAAANKLANEITAGFNDYLLAQSPTADQMLDASWLGQQWATYLQTPEVLAKFAEANQALGPLYAGAIQNSLTTYLTGTFAGYLTGAMAQAMQDAASEAMEREISAAISAMMIQLTGQLQTQLGTAIGSSLESQMAGLTDALQGAFSIDTNAFANAFQFNMTQEDLTSLLTNYMNAEELTYDNNLTKLGYASDDNPNSIAIYSKDFAAKEDVLSIIDGYNDDVSADGDDSNVIQYSDIAGVLMSSVTDIVNMISLVLIAFVSISLVVSSIMIGIVTYISVLERKKEIGILRSLGASRGNVANVFNAETIIEGLTAGVFAIAVVVLASIPVNAIVLATQGVPDVMQLPWTSAVVLILISVALTLVAGLLPSQKAAHADPVEALRSE